MGLSSGIGVGAQASGDMNTFHVLRADPGQRRAFVDELSV